MVSSPPLPVADIGNGVVIVGAEHHSQVGHGLIHDLEEVRIEVTHERCGECLRDVGVRVRWPRPHQQAFGYQHG